MNTGDGVRARDVQVFEAALQLRPAVIVRRETKLLNACAHRAVHDEDPLCQQRPQARKPLFTCVVRCNGPLHSQPDSARVLAIAARICCQSILVSHDDSGIPRPAAHANGAAQRGHCCTIERRIRRAVPQLSSGVVFALLAATKCAVRPSRWGCSSVGRALQWH